MKDILSEIYQQIPIHNVNHWYSLRHFRIYNVSERVQSSFLKQLQKHTLNYTFHICELMGAQLTTMKVNSFPIIMQFD